MLKIPFIYKAGTVVIAAACASAALFWAGYHVRSLSAERDAAQLQASLYAAQAQAQATARQAETALNVAKEKADHDYQTLVTSTATQISTLDAANRRLQQRLSAAQRARKAAAHTGPTARTDEAGTDWITGFATCADNYAKLAKDDARRADKINGLQGYIRGIRSAQ